MNQGYSAVTIVNAFATGKGAAVGIDLKTEVEIDIIEKGLKGDIQVRGKSYHDYSLIKAVKETISNHFNLNFGLEFSIRSEIPVGKGLKGSSAVSNVVTESIVKTLDLSLDDMEVIDLAVKASKKAGVTITGAFDDACASYFGGLCFTDNINNKLIKREKIGKNKVVLLIPEKTVLTKDLEGSDFGVLRSPIQRIFSLGLDGDWGTASFLNGIVYSSFLGYDQTSMIEALDEESVVGLCGKGPALFAITKKPKPLIKNWKRSGEVIVSEIR